MARIKANVRKYRQQRRYAVDEIRLRELNREAHRRAVVVRPEPGSKKTLEQTHFEHQIKDLMGVSFQELPSELNHRRRVFLGLEEKNLKTPRDDVLWKLKLVRLMSRTELVFRSGPVALFLIREGEYWYFLFRRVGSYYKKSTFYSDRSKALDRYKQEKILWLEVHKDC